jgi:hypothetical protein
MAARLPRLATSIVGTVEHLHEDQCHLEAGVLPAKRRAPGEPSDRSPGSLARFALGRLRTPAYRMCDGVAGFVPPAYAGTSRLLTDFARCPGVAC